MIFFGEISNHVYGERAFPFLFGLEQSEDKACLVHWGTGLTSAVDLTMFLISVPYRSVKVCFQSEPMITVLDVLHPLYE